MKSLIDCLSKCNLPQAVRVPLYDLYASPILIPMTLPKPKQTSFNAVGVGPICGLKLHAGYLGLRLLWNDAVLEDDLHKSVTYFECLNQ